MGARVLVTGASGHVGSAVVHALLARGLEPTAALRDPAGAHGPFGAGVPVTRLDFHDRSTWGPATAGQQHLFLMRPPAIADVEHTLLPFADAAREAGVDHIVFLSVAGAGRNRLVPHRAVEDHLRARGDHHTNLRPGFFAQNLQSAYRRDIVEDDRIYVPAGTRPVNWIDVRDVAEVAALVLQQPGPHRGASYTLTGPGPVAWSTVVDALSSALGRTIVYQPASIPGYLWHLKRRRLPAGAILVQTILHVLLRSGSGATEDRTLETLLGRPGRTVQDYIDDHATLWSTPDDSGGGHGRTEPGR